MNIKVLGAGCSKCHALDKAVREVVQEMKLDASVEYVTDMQEIIQYPILATPGLVINEKLVVAGKVPDKKQLVKYFTDAQVNKPAKIAREGS
jgi:small redox-active disulfide protein 2